MKMKKILKTNVKNIITKVWAIKVITSCTTSKLLTSFSTFQFGLNICCKKLELLAKYCVQSKLIEAYKNKAINLLLT